MGNKIYKTVKNIKTKIYHKRQLIIIEFAKNDYVFLHPNQIPKKLNIDITELEILIGSVADIEFYNKGETMFDGDICRTDNLLINRVNFVLLSSVEKLREYYKDKLKTFYQITDIIHFEKYNRINVRVETDKGNVFYFPLKKFYIETNIGLDELELLVHSYISPEYYKKGDITPDGMEITYDNVLKTLNTRYYGSMKEMREINHLDYDDDFNENDSSLESPQDYGYSSWDEMSFNTAFEGDIDAWNEHNQ